MLSMFSSQSLTEVAEIMFEVIREMEIFASGVIKKFDIDNLIGILICGFNHTYKVVCY